jgi:hypothetical protein
MMHAFRPAIPRSHSPIARPADYQKESVSVDLKVSSRFDESHLEDRIIVPCLASSRGR